MVYRPVGTLTTAATTTAQSAFSGAVLLGVVGAVYGAVAAPRKSFRRDDAIHYGLLGAAVGGIAAALLTAPSAASASTSSG